MVSWPAPFVVVTTVTGGGTVMVEFEPPVMVVLLEGLKLVVVAFVGLTVMVVVTLMVVSDVLTETLEDEEGGPVEMGARVVVAETVEDGVEEDFEEDFEEEAALLETSETTRMLGQ